MSVKGGQKGLKTGKLTIFSKLLDIYYGFNYNINWCNSDLFHKVVADERAATEAVSRRQ
jgi:hypothetical protein